MEETQEKPKAVIVYICSKHKEYTIVQSKDTTTVIDGKIIKEPVKYIRFLPSPYGGRFETDDPVQQTKIEGLPEFKKGLIARLGDKAKLKAIPPSHPVIQGGVSTRPGPKPALKPPAESPAAPPAAAKVPMVDPEPEPEVTLPAEEEKSKSLI